MLSLHARQNAQDLCKQEFPHAAFRAGSLPFGGLAGTSPMGPRGCCGLFNQRRLWLMYKCFQVNFSQMNSNWPQGLHAPRKAVFTFRIENTSIIRIFPLNILNYVEGSGRQFEQKFWHGKVNKSFRTPPGSLQRGLRREARFFVF